MLPYFLLILGIFACGREDSQSPATPIPLVTQQTIDDEILALREIAVGDEYLDAFPGKCVDDDYVTACQITKKEYAFALHYWTDSKVVFSALLFDLR